RWAGIADPRCRAGNLVRGDAAREGAAPPEGAAPAICRLCGLAAPSDAARWSLFQPSHKLVEEPFFNPAAGNATAAAPAGNTAHASRSERGRPAMEASGMGCSTIGRDRTQRRSDPFHGPI